MKTKMNILRLAGAILLLAATPLLSISQDTFSICAVDSATGQVGSAGATCIASSVTSAIIISDVHPGWGVVHTQASWISANQIYARSLMDLAVPPQQIIDSMVAHDAGGDPTVRQYGVVDLVGGGRSAGYTGVNCLNYHNHITGPYYSIQGNILLGQQILDSMESRFLNTSGNLACRLMAALQGAKQIGADTRCASAGISSYSAFIRVANPADTSGPLWLDLTVNTFPGSSEPIDVLQFYFDQTNACSTSGISIPPGGLLPKVFPNPFSDYLRIESRGAIVSAELYDAQGKMLRSQQAIQFPEFEMRSLGGLAPGIYFLKMNYEDGNSTRIRLMK